MSKWKEFPEHGYIYMDVTDVPQNNDIKR